MRGTRSSLGSVDMPARAPRDIPGTFGDPFQAISALPGVAPIASGLPFLYVRGAPPADTGYFLDGIALPALFHIGPGPSVVLPALVDRMDFFPSTTPARYGRFVGGVVAAETAPPSPIPKGEASVRLFDASAYLESPLDAHSTALAAGRYGYPNLLLSLFAPHLSLAYGDYTFRLTRDLGIDDRVTLLAIGSFDTERDESQGLVPVDTSFHRLDLRADHKWSGGSLRIATTLGYDHTATPLAQGANAIAAETSVRTRFEVTERWGTKARVSGGADVNALLDTLGNTNVHPEAQQIGGAYAEVLYRPGERLELTAGIRADAYRSNGVLTTSVDPKLALRLRLAPGLAWVSTVGIAHQAPTYLLPVPGLRLDPSAGLQTAYQYAAGIELRLPWVSRATVTGYYTADRNMNDFVSDCGGFLVNCNVIASVDGRGYGLEVLAERAFSQRLAGWLSYTLSRAERRIGQQTFLSPFDRTHVFSAVMRYLFGAGIEAGARGTYYTGRPDIPSFSTSGQPVGLVAGPVLQHRLPSFYRIDARVSKRFSLGARAWLNAVFEFFDATLSQESVEYRCENARSLCAARAVGPIALPSVGLEGGF